MSIRDRFGPTRVGAASLTTSFSGGGAWSAAQIAFVVDLPGLDVDVATPAAGGRELGARRCAL